VPGESLAARAEEALRQALGEVEGARDAQELENVRVRWLGRKGQISELLGQLGKLPASERGAAGAAANRAKSQVSDALQEKLRTFKGEELRRRLEGERIDLTAPGARLARGTLHPLTQLQYEIEDIFRSLGFEIVDGPEVEREYYNFEALNIPAHHPARDLQDTYWLTDGNVLRTHTSPVQIRAMETRRPPFRVLAPGRVYRNESLDASHEHTFYQVEGLYVDQEVSLSHMAGILNGFLETLFGQEVRVRLRPGYFPFVEPGCELDFQCLLCRGKGCPACKRTGWVEMCGCGLVHPNVLRHGRIDPAQWSGFAFGLGLNRLAMMRYGIPDIRLFQSGDLAFLNQF
jgi:phenylalanyl-tRNA synthetase alpha chain